MGPGVATQVMPPLPAWEHTLCIKDLKDPWVKCLDSGCVSLKWGVSENHLLLHLLGCLSEDISGHPNEELLYLCA